MIIVLATQKGGTGKTTIAIALANYLVQFKEERVKVYDLDYQKSFFQKWKEDEILDMTKLYDVEVISNAIDFFDVDKINEMKDSKTYYIFDLAGTLDDSYTDLLHDADFIIIPFEYSDVSVKSTLVFNSYLGYSCSEAYKIFVRSKYDKGYHYPNQIPMDAEISRFGKLIEHPVFKRNVLQTINTRGLEYNERIAVKNTLEEIINTIEEISRNNGEAL